MIIGFTGGDRSCEPVLVLHGAIGQLLQLLRSKNSHAYHSPPLLGRHEKFLAVPSISLSKQPRLDLSA